MTRRPDESSSDAPRRRARRTRRTRRTPRANGVSPGRSAAPRGRLAGERALLEVLRDDRFRLAERCRARLDEGAWFLSHERFVLRAMARVAHGRLEAFDEPEASGDAWIEACVDRALADVLEEPFREELVGIPPERSVDRELYESFAQDAEMDLGSARAAIRVLNEVTPAGRACFRALVLEGTTAERHALRTERPVAWVRRTLRDTFVAIRIELRERARRDAGRPNER